MGVWRKTPIVYTFATRGRCGSTSWCPHCKRARAYFAEKGIRFTEIDVEKSESGRRDYEALGGKGVPVILVGDRMMRGFSPAGFERLRRKS